MSNINEYVYYSLNGHDGKTVLTQLLDGKVPDTETATDKGLCHLPRVQSVF